MNILFQKRIKIVLMLLAVALAGVNHPEIGAGEYSLAQETSKDFTDVAKKAIPAVVFIKAKILDKQPEDQDRDEDYLGQPGDDFFRQFFFGIPRRNRPTAPQTVVGQGSGFIVSENGHVLTNSHLVNNSSDITVILNDGTELPAKILGQDPNTDVAVLKIEGNHLPFLELGNSEKLDIGQWVVAIGNPLGLQTSLTVGVVSAKGRNNLDLISIEDFIQTDAAINRGNSGGPLLDLQGLVIGMNTAIVTNGGGGGYMGIGFAIPSEILRHIMNQIVNSGSVARGFIGVTMQEIDKDLAQAFGLKHPGGALVADVTKGSPAEKAGLKQGDVIQTYNKLSIANIGTLRNAIALMTPGTRITLGVLRGDKQLEIAVDVGDYPQSTPKIASMSGTKLGFEIQDLTPELGKSLGTNEESGVVITKVEPGSAAAWVGLARGALILSVNHKSVSNVDQFHGALQGVDSNKAILLLVKQGDITRYLSLKVK